MSQEERPVGSHQKQYSPPKRERERIPTIVFSSTPLPSLRRASREISFDGAEELNCKLNQLYTKDYNNGSHDDVDTSEEQDVTVYEQDGHYDLSGALALAGWQLDNITDKKKKNGLGLIHFESSTESLEKSITTAKEEAKLRRQNKDGSVARCFKNFFHTKRRSNNSLHSNKPVARSVRFAQ
jgi:hypothetical protein